MLFHFAACAISLVAAACGAISLRIVVDTRPQYEVCACVSLYALLGLGHATRLSLIVSVVSIIAHVAYLLFFASTELTIRLNDSTQQNPTCSPNCVRNNSLLLADENWLLFRGSLAISCLQIVANSFLLACTDGDLAEEPAPQKAKLD